MEHFNPESTDLASLALQLQETVGEAVAGVIVGRTQIRDEVVRHLGCSLLQGEQMVDTMVARGFLVLQSRDDGMEYWSIRSR